MASKKARAVDEKLCGNHRETARLLGISEQALWKAVKDRGCPVLKVGGPGKPNVYHWPDVIAWRVQDLMPEELDLNAERARLAKEQADKTALENAVRRGQMVDALVVVNEWTDQIAAARSRLLATPTKLAPQLVGLQDANVVALAIRTEIYAALAELAEYEPDDAAGGAAQGDAAGGEGVGAAAGADRQPVGRRKSKAELRE